MQNNTRTTGWEIWEAAARGCVDSILCSRDPGYAAQGLCVWVIWVVNWPLLPITNCTWLADGWQSLKLLWPTVSLPSVNTEVQIPVFLETECWGRWLRLNEAQEGPWSYKEDGPVVRRSTTALPSAAGPRKGRVRTCCLQVDQALTHIQTCGHLILDSQLQIVKKCTCRLTQAICSISGSPRRLRHFAKWSTCLLLGLVLLVDTRLGFWARWT